MADRAWNLINADRIYAVKLNTFTGLDRATDSHFNQTSDQTYRYYLSASLLSLFSFDDGYKSEKNLEH